METTKHDLKTAKRIAYFGAIKMDAQNYEIRSVWSYDMIGGQLRGGAHTVRDNMTAAQRSLTCTCPFFAPNGVCKHTLRISWMVQDAEQTALRNAEEDAWAEEAMARIEAVEGLEGDALTRSYGRA